MNLTIIVVTVIALALLIFTMLRNRVRDHKDAVEAERRVRLVAEQGNAAEHFFFGLMYDNGMGVPEDAVEAVRWYRLAAEQGLAAAQCNLGRMYDNGEGVPEDAVEAVRWYRLAAEQGDAAAQFILGRMYDSGEGVPEDAVEAVRLVPPRRRAGRRRRAVHSRAHVRQR